MTLRVTILIHLVLLFDKADSKKGELPFFILLEQCWECFILQVLYIERMVGSNCSMSACNTLSRWTMTSFSELKWNVFSVLFCLFFVIIRSQMWRNPLCSIWQFLQPKLPRPIPLQHTLFLANCGSRGLLCPPHFPLLWAGVPRKLCLWLH